MKLATAYRRLWPHRHRWEIRLNSGIGHNTVEARAVARFSPPQPVPSEFSRCGTGLAQAMISLADRLDTVEAAIKAIKKL